MTQKILIESLSMDLLRVALGLHRGSLNMAKQFKEEALKREEELKSQDVSPYIKKLLTRVKPLLLEEGKQAADDFLMYSVMFQNFAKKY